MTIAYTCILIFIFISYGLTAYAKFSQTGYDNNKPRLFLGNLKGKAQRAFWAHQNCQEALPIFCAGVIIAHLLGLNQAVIDLCAVSFCLLRILYAYFYIIDKSTLRSISWFLAFAINIYLISGAFFTI